MRSRHILSTFMKNDGYSDTATVLVNVNSRMAIEVLVEALGETLKCRDIYLIQKLLEYRNVNTTQNYLRINYATASLACEAMALGFGTLQNKSFIKLTLLSLF